MTAGDRDYVQQLGAVLRRRDAGALRAFLIEQAARYGDDRQVAAIQQQGEDELMTLLHRMILARGDLADLHAESQRWLSDHGAVPPGAPPGNRRRPPPPHSPPRRPPTGAPDPGRDGSGERGPGGRSGPGDRPPGPGPGGRPGPGRRPRRPPRPS